MSKSWSATFADGHLALSLAIRVREVKMNGRTITLSIGYSDDVGGGGFSKSHTVVTPTNFTKKIFVVCKELFY
ncbi:hypothetical protein [Paenibacillus sp. NRS-1760]|uniref:DinB/UmuC family translesion DNA polymerase n=1 Tax=Paenibacillus sp. NRS-1760 TaxID=3233902 RepID=UPI003D29320C